MATVTGLTAARMQQIEANSIVDGAVVGDDLILEKHNSDTINAGNVRGPAGLAASLGFSDDFLTDKKASYTFNAGDPAWNVAGGVLAPALGTTIRAFVSGYTPADFEMLIKLTTGASITGVVLDLLAVDQDQDSSDGLCWELASGDKQIYTVKNGVFAAIAGSLAAGVFANTSMWYRFVKAGNYVCGERFTAAPTYKADATDRVEATLGGANITRFGAMVKGPIGFRFSPGSVNAATIDDLVIRGLDL
jgi:hypothetical protein